MKATCIAAVVLSFLPLPSIIQTAQASQPSQALRHPLSQNFIADKAGFPVSYAVPVFVFAYLILYSLKLSKGK